MNGIIIIDKPSGWTSHDVVGKLRSVLRQRRIGHGGTLDPMATGVLPVFIGRATRAAQFCENAEKGYIAALRPGITTDTQDITGNITKVLKPEFSEEQFVNTLSDFVGIQSQMPPMYSAVKIGGKKLYELARRGETVERKPRQIEIKSIDYLGKTVDGDYKIKVMCSKGTYIRTLCNDIGEALGCGGTLSYLRRVKAGSFDEKDAVKIEDVISAAENGDIGKVLRPVDSLFYDLEKVIVTEKRNLKAVYNGGEYETDVPDGEYRVYGGDGVFLMLGRAQNGKMKTIKSFFEVE